MSALHLTATQYFCLAGLYAVMGFALRGFGGLILTTMAKQLKAHWKLIGIETNSYRTRGSQYTLYEHGEMENMYDRIFNTSVQWVIVGIVGLVVSIVVECLFILPAPPLYVLSIISAWIAAWFLFIVVSNYITTGTIMWLTRYQLYRQYPNIKF